MVKVDLHIHSDVSDGSDNLRELSTIISDAGIKIFALTDHDTIDGCKKIVDYLEKDVTFIPSVELTCEYKNTRCHILGFNCNVNNQELNNLIKKGRILRKNKLETRINFLKDKWGIELTQEEKDWLYSRNSVVKTHVANILVNRELANNNIEAMDKYLKGCKTPNSKFNLKEAISAIKASGGIPVWAHSLGGEGEIHISKDVFFERFKDLKKAGIMGLECYYSRYNHNEIEFLRTVAIDNNLLISGGSDYHGTNKDIPICLLNSSNDYVDSKELTILEKIL